MGAHFDYLKAIFDGASPRLYGILLWNCSAVLSPGHIDLTGIERDDSDDVLTALKKREARREAYWGKDKEFKTWDELYLRLRQLCDQVGISEAWLVSSLVTSLEQDVKFMIRDDLEAFLVRNAEMIAILEERLAEAHEEDKPRWEGAIEMLTKVRRGGTRNPCWQHCALQRVACPRGGSH